MSPVAGAARLPTRCPSCKGALIRRGAGWTHGASVWFYCFFCKHAWKSRFADARATADGELTGAMFIVARREERQPLRRGVVHAIAEEALTTYLERRTAARALWSGKLQRDIETRAATLAKARAEENRLWHIQKQDESNLHTAQAWSAAYNHTKKVTKQLEDLRTRQQLTAEHFLNDLPSPIATATTNADGTFKLAIPREGRFGIAARASRVVDGEEQTHVWVVWISLDGQPAKHLVLNHDNLVGAGSREPALQEAVWPAAAG